MYSDGGEQERKDAIKVTVVRIVEVEGKWESSNWIIVLYSWQCSNVPDGRYEIMINNGYTS